MAIAPRKAKELYQLLDDPDLKQKFYNLIARADAEFLDEMNSTLIAYMRQKGIDLSMLDHAQAEKGFQLFFKKNRMAGEYIKLF